MSIDISFYRDYVGRQTTSFDTIHPFPYAALSAILDRECSLPALGTSLPPLWHWLYFLPLHVASTIGLDGHAKLGSFLPNILLPRRMWAGGRFIFEKHLQIGESVKRVSTIKSIVTKQGRSGPLCFVTVKHEISGDAGGLIVEEHDIVYREMPKPQNTSVPKQSVTHQSLWSASYICDEVFLFRYSALTFNSHRIHYDRRYVTEVEGYPGLVVHGPLIATLLADLAIKHIEKPMRSFKFRAVGTVFDGDPFTVHGQPNNNDICLWARDKSGYLVMEATSIFGSCI